MCSGINQVYPSKLYVHVLSLKVKLHEDGTCGRSFGLDEFPRVECTCKK